jgi:hypothetical protein
VRYSVRLFKVLLLLPGLDLSALELGIGAVRFGAIKTLMNAVSATINENSYLSYVWDLIQN